MAQKQSIFGRIAQLAKANINALLDNAEDPQKMIDQLIRDFTNNIAEAESSVAQTIGNLRLQEKDRDEDLAAAKEWGSKAAAANAKAQQLRTAGQTAEADRFDGLVRIALQKQITAENEAKSAEPLIAQQTEVVNQLKAGVQQMRTKLDDLKGRRDSLVARQKTASAQKQVNEAIGNINVLDPTSELSRFEEKIRREEAMVQGQAELQSSSIEAQFAELTDPSVDLELEARLAALKGEAPKA
ncbi:PspA/IM30 family protein [Micrococcales bacterium 31B]|nr:PspA/IM30 family protein [Micrococcales bacterium 31B]